jgi:hypothetical protein
MPAAPSSSRARASRDPEGAARRAAGRWLFWVCAALYLWTAPGRILFPDDEIVFQTTRALVERQTLAIEGIPKRTGELRGRADGTFGWAPGPGGERYGFFGHALAIAAVPGFLAGKLAATHAPTTWRHALRSDHYYLHARSQEADWTRLGVTLTNVWVTPLAAWLLLRWLIALGFAWRAAVGVALLFATGTLAWPYSRTFLSEPLSTAMLVGCAWCIAEFHGALDRGAPQATRRWSLGAGAFAAIVCHVHVLNLVALPCLLGYALGGRPSARRAAVPAVAVAAVGVALLLLGQWLRYGSAFETGRYDHYSHWIPPAEGLAATLVGPGRSMWLYSPVLLLALPLWPALRRRLPAVAWFVVAICVTRWLLVGARSDWWGGWSIGPRYLVPLVPFAMVPLAIGLERFATLALWRRIVALAVVGAAVLLEAYLSLHSIFEWMLHLTTTGTPDFDYLRRSHWLVGSSPLAGFASLPIDTLSTGAIRLAGHGHRGPLWCFIGAAVVGVVAALLLARSLRTPAAPPAEP